MPISLCLGVHLHVSPSGHVFNLRDNLTNCDYERLQVLKAVLRKIKGFRNAMPTRFANRWHVEGGWRLGQQALPNFGNYLPIETTSYTGKVLEHVWQCEVLAQSQINLITILTVPVLRIFYFTRSSNVLVTLKEMGTTYDTGYRSQ